MAKDVYAQISSESGAPGSEPETRAFHGQFQISNVRGQRQMLEQLRDVLQAADHLAGDGRVVRVMVLTFPAAALDLLANNN